MSQKKFQVLSVLNSLADGELCRCDIFHDSFSFSMPESIVSGDFQRVLAEVKNLELFRWKSEAQIEILRYLEGAEFSFVEARMLKDDGFLSCAFFFEFLDSKIKKVRAYYPSSRSLSMSEETVDLKSLAWPADVGFFMEALASGDWERVKACFDKDGQVKNSYQDFLGVNESRNERFLKRLLDSPQPQIFRCFDAKDFCFAEAYWGFHKTLFLWMRSENQKFESWEFFGKSDCSFRSKSAQPAKTSVKTQDSRLTV